MPRQDTGAALQDRSICFPPLTLSIPGLVLGLAYVLAFKRTALYETMGILIFSSIIHFFTTPYLMLYQTFGKLNANLGGTGRVLGVPPFCLFANVFLPQCAETLLDMFSYFFLNAMGHDLGRYRFWPPPRPARFPCWSRSTATRSTRRGRPFCPFLSLPSIFWYAESYFYSSTSCVHLPAPRSKGLPFPAAYCHGFPVVYPCSCQ